MNLTLSYPAWYILLCLALGAVVAFILYYRDWQFRELGTSFRKWLWVMAIIRFAAVSFIAFLLLSPLIRTITSRVEKPILALVQDNSQSIRFGSGKDDSLSYTAAIRNMVDDLSKDYDVRTYSFGSSLKEGLSFTHDEKTTNISSALDQVATDYTRQNLGAIILATDGIFNEGNNPVYLQNELNVPVYTIGLGDTTRKRDLQLMSVLHNRLVFFGDYFTVKAEWSAQFCSGERTAISIAEVSDQSEKKLDEKPLLIEGNDISGSNEFLLKADKSGILHYRIAISKVDGEASAVNNIRDVFVEVVEKKEKILILANSPHPDIAALKQSIEVNKNYEVDVAFGSDIPGKPDDYNLIILHQLPSQGTNIQTLLSAARSKNKSLLFILGSQTNASLLNSAQSLVNLTGGNGSTSDAFPVLSADFTLFNIPENVNRQLSSWPPLGSPFGDYIVSQSASVLFNQKIGSVPTKYPMILFQQDLDGRVGMIAGEGLWRWRMNDYEQNNNHDAFNSLISAIVQYLSVKADERQFRVRLEKEQFAGGNRIYSENESVIFNAELLNESNELINGPDVSLTIRDEQGKEYPFIFSKTVNAYTLNAGYFPEGNYTYTAKVEYNKKNFTGSGSFTVSPTQLEFEATRANHQLLYALSEKTGGQLFYPSQIDEIGNAIKSKQEIKPVLYSSTRTEPIINLRWLIVPILLLLTLEWGIRKFNGGY